MTNSAYDSTCFIFSTHLFNYRDRELSTLDYVYAIIMLKKIISSSLFQDHVSQLHTYMVTLSLPLVTETEFLLTTLIPYQADK